MRTKILGNYLEQPHQDFPIDCELFDNIQGNMEMLAAIGNIAGDKTILFGCETSDNDIKRGPGYVFLCTKEFPQGEVLYFDGEGEGGNDLHVVTVNSGVATNTNEYDFAYTERRLKSGKNSALENFKWSDFAYLRTNRQLADRSDEQDAIITQLAPVAPGTIMMWGGGVSDKQIPEHYMLCDGRGVSRKKYPRLFDALGYTHNSRVTSGDIFYLPNLQGRFVFGTVPGGKYNIASSGGTETVALSANNIPAHVHSVNDYYYIENGMSPNFGSEWVGQGLTGGGKTDHDNRHLWYKTHNTFNNTTTNTPHNNMPPYYVLSYIIRVD